MNVNELKGQTIGFLASGGLDSCTITHWLSEKGVKVVCFTADLAQPDETDFGAIEKRMRACGASSRTFAAISPAKLREAMRTMSGLSSERSFEGVSATP